MFFNQPSGYFIGQVRRRGAQTWETVTGRCRSAEAALSKALMSMQPNDHRARALWVDREGWYGTRVALETTR